MEETNYNQHSAGIAESVFVSDDPLGEKQAVYSHTKEVVWKTIIVVLYALLLLVMWRTYGKR